MAQEVSKHARQTVSRQLITQLEVKGDRKPHYLQALAATMGTTADALLKGQYQSPSHGAVIHAAEGHRTPYEAVVREELTIPQFNTGGAMGNGLVLRDQPGMIQSWNVTPDWVQKNVHNFTSLRNLAIVTGFGDSMRPLFNPGDPLLVDRGVTSVEFDAIYFFRVGEEGFVKRLQRIPGNGLLVISENRSYRDWSVTDGMDFEVFARVIKVWRGEDF